MRIEFDSTEEFLSFMEKIAGKQDVKNDEDLKKDIGFLREQLISVDSNVHNLQKEVTGDITKIQESLLQLKLQPNKTTQKTDKKRKKYHRKYSMSAKKNLPKTICGLTEDGHFKLGRNGKEISKYTIQEILKLKKMVYDRTVVSFKQMAPHVPNINAAAVSSFCYGIESGFFDPLINEWEQKQANDFYHNAKKVVTPVNNPQKRKDMGLM